MKRIRAYLGGELVADTTQPLLVWEKPYYPVYYFPAADVRTELLAPDGGTTHSPSRGDGHTFAVTAGGVAATGATLRYEQSPQETSQPTLVFETGLPVRYYLPKTHVRLDLLTPSDSVSHCPFKGEAEYWSLRAGDIDADVAWSYRTPLPESQKIAGLIAFYTEKVDLYVDGVLQGGSAKRFV
jgi:uncharacterized protein (DUF427 family)